MMWEQLKSGNGNAIKDILLNRHPRLVSQSLHLDAAPSWAHGPCIVRGILDSGGIDIWMITRDDDGAARFAISQARSVEAGML